ncbi:MAG TPA: hypothetical protein VLL08_33270 [Kineosporiaceae bacterium]|nr:hypothetical protein [Kineosporiaceae bacterium]
MSDVSHLQRQVRQVSSQVSDVNSLVQRAQQQLTAVSVEVGGVAAAQKETQNELARLQAELHKYFRQAELAANLGRAETKFGNLQGEMEHTFGHHKRVRRTATGLLQAFDVGLVSEDTVRSIGEELMIDAPRYWLAPALVGLAAWSRDDQEVCARAIETAFGRSPSRTALFFTLILRRQGRLPSATRWLRHYLDSLSPSALGRDFAVILEAVAQGAFGAAARDLVRRKMSEWAEQLGNDDNATATQVARWREEIERYRGKSASDDFPKLSTLSPQWPDLDRALAGAASQQGLLDTYRAMMAEEPKPSARIEDAVDDILDRLVSEYDVEELPLKRQLDEQEAIIESHGDLDAAKQVAELQSAARDETLDYLTIQSTSALLPDQIGVSRATQRVAVSACEPWLREAHAQYTLEYRQQIPDDVRAKISSQLTFGSSAFKMQPWEGSFIQQMPDLERDLARHWDRAIDPFVQSLRFDWGKAAILPTVVLVSGFIFFAAVGAVVFGLIAALVGGAIWGGLIWMEGEQVEKTGLQAEAALKKAKAESLRQLRQAGAELTDWSTRFQTEDRKETDVRSMFDDLRRAGGGVQPFEQRSFAQN